MTGRKNEKTNTTSQRQETKRRHAQIQPANDEMAGRQNEKTTNTTSQRQDGRTTKRKDGITTN